MKTKIITLVIALIISGTMVFAQNNSKSSKKQILPIEKEPLKDSVYYTCSSHPEIRRENPGLCPKCGLILEEISVSKLRVKHYKKGINKPYSCSTHPKICMEKSGICPKCGAKLEKRSSKTTDSENTDKEIVKTYTCTMHPEVKKDKPGTCPKCGMELVEKKYSADLK